MATITHTGMESNKSRPRELLEGRSKDRLLEMAEHLGRSHSSSLTKVELIEILTTDDPQVVEVSGTEEVAE